MQFVVFSWCLVAFFNLARSADEARGAGGLVSVASPWIEPRGDAVRWRIIAADDCPGPAQIRQSPCAILTIPRFFARAAHPIISLLFLCVATKSSRQANHRAERITGPSRSEKNQAAQDRITGRGLGPRRQRALAGWQDFASATKRMRWPRQQDDWRRASVSCARPWRLSPLRSGPCRREDRDAIRRSARRVWQPAPPSCRRSPTYKARCVPPPSGCSACRWRESPSMAKRRCG